MNKSENTGRIRLSIKRKMYELMKFVEDRLESKNKESEDYWEEEK